MRCLKIHDKWLQLILLGKKDIELRRTQCNFRGRIALGNPKTGNVEGYVTVVDCRELSLSQLRALNHRHHAFDFLEEYAVGRNTLFAWFFKDVEIETAPYAYSFSTGCWCKAERVESND